VFSVEIPRGQQPVALRQAVPVVRMIDSLCGTLVMLVDDDALVRDAMQSLLVQWGCEVAVAADGEEAASVLERLERLPDILLCDYRLPGAATGVQVIQRLHAVAGAAIPAALVSGDIAPESQREAKASGYPVLLKPVAPAKLRALVEHLALAPPRTQACPADQDSAV
jgi:CheY-like chemotaxis protein